MSNAVHSNTAAAAAAPSAGAVLHALDDVPTPLLPGTRLSRFTIAEVLGTGGFGISYRAREDITGREVAIKEHFPAETAVRADDGATLVPLSARVAGDYADALQRFRGEAKVLAGLSHPNIVPVLAYFEANGTGYLVMAYHQGTSLAAVLEEQRVLSEAETLAIARPLLDGVEEVHRRGFLHRDLKPGNIFVQGDGTPVLLDFGAACAAPLTAPPATMVTDGYAPLEQYDATVNQGPWSDIYALGAVMFRCLLGRPPLAAPSRAGAIARGQPDPLAQDLALLRQRANSDLGFAIEAALRLRETERPQSIAALRELVAEAIPANPAPALSAPEPKEPAVTLLLGPRRAGTPGWHVPQRPYDARTPRWRKRKILLGAMVVLAAGGGAFYSAQGHRWLAAFHLTPTVVKATPVKHATLLRKQRHLAAARPQARALQERAAQERAVQEEMQRGMAEYQRRMLALFEAEQAHRAAAAPAPAPKPAPLPPSAEAPLYRPASPNYWLGPGFGSR